MSILKASRIVNGSSCMANKWLTKRVLLSDTIATLIAIEDSLPRYDLFTSNNMIANTILISLQRVSEYRLLDRQLRKYSKIRKIKIRTFCLEVLKN